MLELRRNDPFLPPSILECVLSSPIKYLLSLLYKLSLSLRSVSPSHGARVRVVCIADTHTLTLPIPDGDILIHAGDLTNAGTTAEIQTAIDWISSLPHQHKIVVAGNHDTYLDPRSRLTLSKPDQNGFLNWKQIIYLQHRSTTIRHGSRHITIHGAPQTPACGDASHAFQYARGQDAWSSTVPRHVDILVTHTPPKFHLDLFHPSVGCEWLLRECWRVRPRLHVCGHVHAAAGRRTLFWDEAQRAYERGMARGDGFFTQVFSPWLWIDTLTVVFYGAGGLLWTRVWGGDQRSTILVNAALMRVDNRLRDAVQVVEI